MRNHPYLSYKSDNVLNPPTPRNFNSPHASSSSRPSLEDALSTFIQGQSEQNQKFESMLTRLDEEPLITTMGCKGKCLLESFLGDRLSFSKLGSREEAPNIHIMPFNHDIIRFGGSRIFNENVFCFALED
nr:hypothetical protein CFP56_55084 [Quercus suber]